jgi:uncharacterized membrane protein YbhN (UPF0104 family)
MSVLSFLQTPTGRILRAVISVGALGALIALTDWRAFHGLQQKIHWPDVILGAVLTALSYPVCAWRWWRLLRAQGIRLPFSRAHAITWIGQFYNAFLPGGIGGDMTRLVYALSDAPTQKSNAATAIGADRLIGFAVLLLLAVGALFFHAAGSSVNVAGMPFWAVAASIVAVGSACFAAAAGWLRPKLPHGLQSALHLLVSSPRINLLAALASIVIWILDFSGGWLLARSLNLPIAFIDLSLGLTIAYLSTALPISIGGHGVREGALVLTLTALGAVTATDQLPSLALLFWAVNLACSLLGGAVLMASREASPSAVPSKTESKRANEA